MSIPYSEVCAYANGSFQRIGNKIYFTMDDPNKGGPTGLTIINVVPRTLRNIFGDPVDGFTGEVKEWCETIKTDDARTIDLIRNLRARNRSTYDGCHWNGQVQGKRHWNLTEDEALQKMKERDKKIAASARLNALIESREVVIKTGNEYTVSRQLVIEEFDRIIEEAKR